MSIDTMGNTLLHTPQPEYGALKTGNRVVKEEGGMEEINVAATVFSHPWQLPAIKVHFPRKKSEKMNAHSFWEGKDYQTVT